VLQCFAVFPYTIFIACCIAVFCSVLRRVATFQDTIFKFISLGPRTETLAISKIMCAAHFRIWGLQCVAAKMYRAIFIMVPHCVAACCSVLRRFNTQTSSSLRGVQCTVQQCEQHQTCCLQRIPLHNCPFSKHYLHLILCCSASPHSVAVCCNISQHHIHFNLPSENDPPPPVRIFFHLWRFLHFTVPWICDLDIRSSAWARAWQWPTGFSVRVNVYVCACVYICVRVCVCDTTSARRRGW